MSPVAQGSRAVAAIAVAARVAAGVLWILEAVVKFRAGFGAADILLVADGALTNSRVPFWFTPVEVVMHAIPGVMGVVIPLMEAGIGVLLVLGVLPRLVAFASVLTLMLYWGSDQLIAQYPIMVVLSVLVIALPGAGGLSGWLRRLRAQRQ